MKFFSLDSPVFRFLTLVSDLMILNLLYVITCLPLFTIGAATSALYRSVLVMRFGRDAGVRVYFQSFKASLKQSTLRYLFSVLIGAVLLFDIWYSHTASLPMSNLLVPVFLLLLTVLLIVSSWVLALTGLFDNTAKGTFKNAVILSLRHLPVSLLLLLRFAPALLALLSPVLFLVVAIAFLLIYYALAAYLAAIPMSRLFLSLMPPEEAEKWGGGASGD